MEPPVEPCQTGPTSCADARELSIFFPRQRIITWLPVQLPVSSTLAGSVPDTITNLRATTVASSVEWGRVWEVHRVPPTMSYHFDCQVNEDQLAHQHRRQGASDTTHDACPLCKGQQGAMARPPHPFHLELEEATPTSHLSTHLCSDSKCGVWCVMCASIAIITRWADPIT